MRDERFLRPVVGHWSSIQFHYLRIPRHEANHRLCFS